jgi:c-di-AMP phosphodiesterase-like protein
MVIIDHHRRSTDYIEDTVMTYHEPYASSTCELITEMLQYAGGGLSVKPVEADALLAGITIDTKNFAVKSGSKTFEAAAYLKRNGADSSRVRILLQNTMKNYELRSKAVNSAETLRGIIAVSTCEGDSVVTAQAADQLLDITGIRASFVMNIENGELNISARSHGDINVQVIMERMGGGGHQTVAGAQYEAETFESIRQRLKAEIEKYLEENGI